jgi:hypothetical protein
MQRGHFSFTMVANRSAGPRRHPDRRLSVTLAWAIASCIRRRRPGGSLVFRIGSRLQDCSAGLGRELHPVYGRQADTPGPRRGARTHQDRPLGSSVILSTCHRTASTGKANPAKSFSTSTGGSPTSLTEFITGARSCSWRIFITSRRRIPRGERTCARARPPSARTGRSHARSLRSPHGTLREGWGRNLEMNGRGKSFRQPRSTCEHLEQG